MKILKKTKRTDMIYLGVQIPKYIHSYITLFHLAEGINKSDVIRDILVKWYNTKKGFQSEKELISNLSSKLLSQWKIIKSNGGKSFEEYKKELQEELTIKEINQKSIDKIINEIKDGEKKSS